MGAFHQPTAVVSDTSSLKTLPEREFRAGLAEVVKHAAIADARLFSYLEKNEAQVLAREAGVMERVVAANCRIKARVVEQDERESGLRQILNYGHTLGHAVEALAGYSSELLHGEAVAIGMSAASRISCAMGRCGSGDVERLTALLDRFGLPTRMAEPPGLAVLKRLVASDKKTRRGSPRFVLMRKIGAVEPGVEVSPRLWRARSRADEGFGRFRSLTPPPVFSTIPRRFPCGDDAAHPF